MNSANNFLKKLLDKSKNIFLFLSSGFLKAKAIISSFKLPFSSRHFNAFPSLALEKLKTSDYILKFSSELLVVVIAVAAAAVSGFSFWQEDDPADRSLAARILSYYPQLNEKLYARQAAIKVVVNEKHQLFPEAYAESLLEAGQVKDGSSVYNYEDDVLSFWGLPGEEGELPELKIADNDSSENRPFEYEVEGGDTVSGIAEKFNLKTETVLWANNLTAKSKLKPGQKLNILPTDGVLHQVAKGDTIGKLAQKYKIDTKNIVAYNAIGDVTKIHAGDLIIIPGGKPLPSAPGKSGGKTGTPGSPSGEQKIAGRLLWPTATKNITQRYGSAHRGLDLANGGRPPVYASHSGTVTFAGRDGDWGNTIVVRGDDGLVTRYSHNTENYVRAGERVEAGQHIAMVGNTGRVRGVTGLHLDFRVYKNGVALNPLSYLK